jgi:hypothetical protein
MSRGDGSYDGEFMEDYTDYDISCHNGDSMMSDIDYYSSMEGMGDNFDYMSKVDKEHYIDNSFDYDMVAHNIDYAQASMDDCTAYTVDTMHDEVDNFYTMPHKTTSSKVEWPRFEQGATYFDSISSSHPRWCHHDKHALAHQDTRDHQIVHQAQHDMGWPDLLVSDAMVMMATDDCRG